VPPSARTWNLLAFNLAAALYFVIGAVFEERKLVREFGQAYVEYRQRTPMLVPGMKIKLSEINQNPRVGWGLK
jgi:protein-S-isoprenylcysteine O-methyltransferase Ste14